MKSRRWEDKNQIRSQSEKIIRLLSNDDILIMDIWSSCHVVFFIFLNSYMELRGILMIRRKTDRYIRRNVSFYAFRLWRVLDIYYMYAIQTLKILAIAEWMNIKISCLWWRDYYDLRNDTSTRMTLLIMIAISTHVFSISSNRLSTSRISDPMKSKFFSTVHDRHITLTYTVRWHFDSWIISVVLNGPSDSCVQSP